MGGCAQHYLLIGRSLDAKIIFVTAADCSFTFTSCNSLTLHKQKGVIRVLNNSFKTLLIRGQQTTKQHITSDVW